MMSPEETAFLDKALAAGFNDAEIQEEIGRRRASAKPRADNAGLVTRALRGVGALDEGDTFGERMKRGATHLGQALEGQARALLDPPNPEAAVAADAEFDAKQTANAGEDKSFLQRAFPKQRPSTDPLQSDPMAGLIVDSIQGAGAGKLVGGYAGAAAKKLGAGPGLARVAETAGSNAGAAAATSGDQPGDAAALAALGMLPVIGRGARKVEKALVQRPTPGGLDLRVMHEAGVEPRTFSEYSDPQGNMPDPKKYAPTDMGRGALGQDVAEEVFSRNERAKGFMKSRLDTQKGRALPAEGAIVTPTDAPVGLADQHAGQADYTTGTKEKLQKLRGQLSTPGGSAVNVSSSIEQAMRRERTAQGLRKRGGESNAAIADQLEAEAFDLREKARLANEEGPAFDILEKDVKSLDETRDLAQHYAQLGKEKKLDLQDKPFVDLADSINAQLDTVAPRLQAAKRRYHEGMGGMKLDERGRRVYSGPQGAEKLMVSKSPETYATRLKSVGEDTGTGGRIKRHETLKNVMETDVDPYADLGPNDKGSRLLLAEPQLLLARQRQKWLGPRPAALPQSGKPSVISQLLGSMASLGEPMLNRGVYPSAKRLSALDLPDGGGPKGAEDILPGILLGRDAKKKKKQDEESP